MEIEINGVRYRQRPVKQEERENPLSGTIYEELLEAYGTVYEMLGKKRKAKFIINDNFVKAYIAIQNKTSKLSRSQRQRVCQAFEDNFERVEI